MMVLEEPSSESAYLGCLQDSQVLESTRPVESSTLVISTTNRPLKPATTLEVTLMKAKLIVPIIIALLTLLVALAQV